MTKQEIFELINKWRDLADGSQVLYDQADNILATEKPCLICAEACNMLGSINALLGQAVNAFDIGTKSGDIPMQTVPQLMVVSERIELMGSWHAVATECVARMSNAAHKQLHALGVQPLDGCAVPRIVTDGEKPQEVQ